MIIGNEAPEASVQALLDVGDKAPKENDLRVGQQYRYLRLLRLLTSSLHLSTYIDDCAIACIVGRDSPESGIRP